MYAVPDKSRKQEAPTIPRGPPKEERVEIKPVPDVGEERLEHMKKMNELKTLMPDAEFNYYSRLVSGPQGNKTSLWGFRHNKTQTSLLSYRDQLENSNLNCSKFRYDTF